jgi:hypothetical protein
MFREVYKKEPGTTRAYIKMSKLVKKHVAFFQLLLTTASKIQRRILLDTITKDDQLRALVEITVNLLRGVLPITPSSKTALGKHKTLLRTIGDKSVSLKKKRRLLCRRGHVIAILLKSVDPALKNFLS